MLSIIAALTTIYFLFIKKSPPPGIVTIDIKNHQFDLEIAKSLSEKSRGLSSRTSLCGNCGMIFVYSNESYYPFWMKDTLIPLDMIWLDKNGRIVTIHTAHPQLDTPPTQLKAYRNSDPAQFIIELNAGKSEEIGLNVGDTILLPSFDE